LVCKARSAALGSPPGAPATVGNVRYTPGAPGRLIDVINAPFTNGLGDVGFTGSLDDADRYVWFGAGVTFLASEALPVVLSGGESTMGISDAGGWIYSPSIDGDDGVWTHEGELAREDVQAPGFPAGTNSTFHSRPRMYANGTAAWVSGFNETGGTSTEGRMLYQSTDATPATISVVLRSDDMIEGLPIDRPSGIDFDYDFSDDTLHHIHVLLMDTGSTTDDGRVYVDGVFVAAEGETTGDGDNRANFDIVSINTDGNYIFTGDTDGASASDEFIAYNAGIVVREGDTLDGVTLVSSASLRAASINNLGEVAHIWGISGGNEILFIGNGPNLGASSIALLMIGDMLDFDGDGVGDAEVTDFLASTAVGPALDLGDDGIVYVGLDVIPVGGTELEVIVGIAYGAEPCQSDINADGFVDVLDLLALLAAWGNTSGPEDINGDGIVDVLDLLQLLSDWGPC
jgi:hypothetical protein